MPRFGSFCSESVLRVPKETSLRIVRSMLRASISRTRRAISRFGRKVVAEFEERLRCGFVLFCALELKPEEEGFENKAKSASVKTIIRRRWLDKIIASRSSNWLSIWCHDQAVL